MDSHERLESGCLKSLVILAVFGAFSACTPDKRLEFDNTNNLDNNCDPLCRDEQRCMDGVCEDNICQPACAPGWVCLTHGADACACLEPPCDQPPAPCGDGLDNDGDGWIDEADPDCMAGMGTEEVGYGLFWTCNDGLDNDGDGLVDASDPDCVSAAHEEPLPPPSCLDECTAGAVQGSTMCRLWDDAAGAWVDAIDDGPGKLHNRARNYAAWLRSRLMPAGGVMRAYFTDLSFSQVQLYGGTRDSAIWTGAYLAAESLRYQATRSPDARAQIEQTLRVLDRWWRISGDTGYLARYAAPASSPAEVAAIFASADTENHRDVPFEADLWNWKGDVSRDQYQGVVLGYALAYDALDAPGDEALTDADPSVMVEAHVNQLRLFPPPPNTAHPVDNRAEYPENPACPGLSLSAIDVDDRVPSTFMWERNPWTLVGEDTPMLLYSGVDYLLTYWMARRYGWLTDDAPDTCLRWGPLP